MKISPEVLNELRDPSSSTVSAIVSRLGLDPVRPAGAQLRGKRCPDRDHHDADFAINANTGRWICHACQTSGDLIGLVQQTLSIAFADAVALAKNLIGAVDDAPRPAMARTRPVDDKATKERAHAIAHVPERWNNLDQHSVDGEKYIHERGLDPAQLIARGYVRFTSAGDVCVLLRSFADGSPINIITRRRVLRGNMTKVVGLPSCPTSGSIIGAVTEIDEGRDTAIVPEGVFDSLAAALLCPTSVVCGAHGAARLVDVAHAVAPRLAEVRGWLAFAPHVDYGVGESACADAVIDAERYGLKLGDSIKLIDVRPDKDLADAMRRGFSWSWLS